MLMTEEMYGPRLGMFLSHCSSEDAEHPASSLGSQTRSTVGWQSSKNCVYPQELGFRFEGEVELQFIRVLVHESKIPSRIEVFVSESDDDKNQIASPKSYGNSTFHRLGYVGFSTNEENDFSARELKTINIRRRCAYVKLLLSRPHRCDYNIYQQVGVVALSSHGILMRTLVHPIGRGEFLIGERAETPMEEMFPPDSEGIFKIGEYANDQLIDMVTARRIEEVRQMKERAAASEDYDVADALKACIAPLEIAGKQIYELEIQKAAAVKEENYIKAKALKHRIEKLREDVYRIPMLRTSHSNEVEPQPKQPVATALADNRPSSPSPLPQAFPSKSQPRSRPQVAPQTSVLQSQAMHDETPVEGRGFYSLDTAENAFDKGSFNGVVPSELIHGKPEWEQAVNRLLIKNSGEQPQALPLEGETLTEARSFEKVFGEYCTACLFGKRGQLREVAIRVIASFNGYTAFSAHSQNVVETLLSYLAMPSRGLSDTAAGVVLASCEALQTIVSGGLPDAPSPSELAPRLQPLLAELVSRSGDNNSRIREISESVFRSLLDLTPLVHSVVSALLHDPTANKKPASYRVHIARLNLLGALVDRYGVSGSKFMALETKSILSKAVMPCLQHSNGEVRDSASLLFAKILLLEPEQAGLELKNLKPVQQTPIQEYTKQLASSASKHRYKVPKSVSSPVLSDDVFMVSEKGTGKNAGVGVGADVRGRPSGGARRAATPPLIENGAHAGDSVDETNARLEKTCPFCGEFDEGFSEAALDIHYLRGCPMLCPCSLCDQVTEIATLQVHLTTECEYKRLVRECPICKEAVRVEDIKKHVASKMCIKAVPTHNVCPLCHARFKAGSAGWLKHFAAPPGCPNNPRKYDGTGPLVP